MRNIGVYTIEKGVEHVELGPGRRRGEGKGGRAHRRRVVEREGQAQKKMGDVKEKADEGKEKAEDVKEKAEDEISDRL